jgi:hypothetical protein
MVTVVNTTAKKAGVPRAGRWIGPVHWLVTVETGEGKVFESLMLFSNEPSSEEIKKFFLRRPEMFQECQPHAISTR